MIKCFMSTYRIRLSMAVNRWIFYLQKIPLVKRLIKDSLYHSLGVKNGMSIFMMVYTILIQVVKKGIYMAMLLLPVMSMVKDEKMIISAFIQLFLFSSVIAGTITHTSLFQTDEDRRVFLRIMRINRSMYIRSFAYSEYFFYVFFMFLGLSICLLILGGNMIQALALVVLSLGFHMLMNVFQMWIFTKWRTIPLVKQSMTAIIIAGVVIIAGYATIVSQFIMDFESYVYYSFIMIIPIIYGIYKIQTYPLYSDVSQMSLLHYEGLLSAVAEGGGASFQDVAINDKDLTDIQKDKKLFRDKKSYVYLNAVFFHRQKRVFYRPIRNRIIVITAIAIATAIIAHFSGVEKVALHKLFPSLFFIMYLMNIGSRATRSLFYNCDVSLLDYSFYRRSDAVLKNFVIRLKYLSIYNFIPASILCIYFVIDILLLKVPYSPGELSLYIMAILLLSILFTVHYLFTYYVFQPFTRDFSLKNPFYFLINTGMYILCYSVVNMNIAGPNFVLYVLIFTILYITIALFSVYRFAPKTFKIR